MYAIYVVHPRGFGNHMYSASYLFLFLIMWILAGQKNVNRTCIKRLLNVLCRFNLRSVSRVWVIKNSIRKSFILLKSDPWLCLFCVISVRVACKNPNSFKNCRCTTYTVISIILKVFKPCVLWKRPKQC